MSQNSQPGSDALLPDDVKSVIAAEEHKAELAEREEDAATEQAPEVDDPGDTVPETSAAVIDGQEEV